MTDIIPFTTSAINQLAEYASLGMLNREQAELVGQRLRKVYDWRTEHGYEQTAVDDRDVDNAVMVVCYAPGDAGGGYGCNWQYGQGAGPLLAGPTKARNKRSVSFRIGNVAYNTFYRREARVMGIEKGRLLVGEAGWPFLPWEPDDCILRSTHRL